MECKGPECTISGTNSGGNEAGSRSCDAGCECPSCSGQDMLKFAEVMWHKAAIAAMFEVKKRQNKVQIGKIVWTNT